MLKLIKGIKLIFRSQIMGNRVATPPAGNRRAHTHGGGRIANNKVSTQCAKDCGPRKHIPM